MTGEPGLGVAKPPAAESLSSDVSPRRLAQQPLHKQCHWVAHAVGAAV